MPSIRSRTAAVIAVIALPLGVAAPAVAATPSPTSAPAVTVAAKEAQLGYWLDAGPRLRSKYGHSRRFFGPIYNGRILGDCVDYGKANPDGDWSTGAFGHVKGDRLRAQIQFIESKYWAAGLRSATYAAARNAAVNRLKDADVRYDWAHSYVKQWQTKDKAVPPLSDRMMTEARLYAGTVKVTPAFTVEPQKKGAAGAVRVTVTANGHAYPGQAITWNATGARITSAAKVTGKDGTATLRLVQTSAAPVTVNAAVVTPDWRRAKFSRPTSSGKQHLVRGVGPVTTRTTISHYTATVTQDCGSECKGRPPVTFTAKAGANPVRWQAVVGAKVLASLSLKAKASGSKTFTGTDGTEPRLEYSVKVGGKWSPWRVSTKFKVVCPAWPEVSLPIVCVCNATRAIPVTFTVPASTRFYVLTLKAGANQQDANAAGGGSVKLTATPKAGDRLVASFVAYADAAHTIRLSGHDIGDITINS